MDMGSPSLQLYKLHHPNGILAGNELTKKGLRLFNNSDRNSIFRFCSKVVGEHWKDSPSSVLDIYHELIAAGLRIWVFRSFLYIYLFFKFCGFWWFKKSSVSVV